MLPPHVILRNMDTLPVAPEVVLRLTPLLSGEDLGGADLERAVRFDPVLTANLIRAANGALEAGSAPVVSLAEAIDRMGAHRLLEVAVGSSLRRTLPARIPGYGIGAGRFWIHCIAVATIAEAIAGRINLPSAGMAFTAGLVHDLGQLAIGDFFAETMPESDWWTFGTPEEERALLSCNHCDIGKAVAERWTRAAGTMKWARRQSKSMPA